MACDFRVAWLLAGVAFTAACLQASDREEEVGARFRQHIQPILVEYCYDCHGDGMNKGNVAFDQFKSDKDLITNRALWLAVLKNLRAGIMPPAKKPRPSAENVHHLADWIKQDAFGIDADDPDPGRVTIRRLNREEYRNTIRDLMGFDFKIEEELPPDDTGYGFDNIGDVLTMSPMLLEKYMHAAETIVAGGVPRVTRVVSQKTIPGSAFGKSMNNRDRAGGQRRERGRDRHSFYDETTLAQTFTAEHAGSYRLALELEVLGQFDFDPGRCRVVFKVDDRELLAHELGWHNNKKFSFPFDQKWTAGEHRLVLELHPLTPAEKETNSLDLRIAGVRIEGPQEKEHWVRPRNFELFFSQDPPPANPERREYARALLRRFVTKAYRRPVDDGTVDRLVTIAESVYTQAAKRFEDGIAQAMIPVLASPRFLFRIEDSPAGSSQPEEAHSGNRGNSSVSHLAGSLAEARSSWVDEYSLASRLSYFLWSTMPDEELFHLAGRGELRKNLEAQVKRMVASRRSDELIENFVGQWLQVRDVEGIDINTRAVLARDSGQDRELEKRRRRFRELRDIPEEKLTPEERSELEGIRAQFRRRFANRPQVELDRELRQALRAETEMCFGYVLRENRSLLELINGDYTFLNERLARHYGMTNVVGNEMRRVELPEDHPRGGVLTHGSVLIVTSNPTRTSPVKRGLFVLDNILGTPPPPPPADIPQLEESEKGFTDRQPTLREVLAIHREKPLCSSCHNRMDPLGLALENFNALGMWREKERGQPIDSAGKLITGESFRDLREVKRILVADRRTDFYRCLTEKLLIYALGRGLEYYDVHTVDQIVERLERENGRFSALLMGVIESAPFQKRRTMSAPDDAGPSKPAEQRAEIKLQP